MHEFDGYRCPWPASVICDVTEDWTFLREPVLRRMPDGSLVCLLLSGGPTEPHDDNVALITRSADDGRTWTPLRPLFEHATRGAWACELFAEEGPPRAFVHTYDPASDKCELRAFASVGDDAGLRWTDPVSLAGTPANFSVRRGIATSAGAWVFPVYWQEQTGDWNWRKTGKGFGGATESWRFRCGVIRTEDAGATFSVHGYLHADCSLWEPNLIETSPGRLVMYIRARGQGVLYRADSADDGRTWSPAVPTELPNPGSKVTLVGVGEAVVMLSNHFPELGRPGRRRLTASVSRDGCATWSPPRVVLEAPESGVACYPDGFYDRAAETLYLAADTYARQYLIRIPAAELPG